MLTALNFLASIFLQAARAASSNRRISEVMVTILPIRNDNVREKEHKIASGAIEFRNVSFRYFKNHPIPVLDRINVKINHGELVGIVGSTGSGKSTFISMIPRLYDPDEGEVLVDGADVRDLSLWELRENLAVVLQKNTLFSGSIAENLHWGNEQATDEELAAACKIAQADSFIRAFPDGYDTKIGQGGSNLSDATKVIIAQRISSVMDADKIIVMEKGAVVACGTHDELIHNCTIYQEIYDSQKEKEGVS